MTASASARVEESHSGESKPHASSVAYVRAAAVSPPAPGTVASATVNRWRSVLATGHVGWPAAVSTSWAKWVTVARPSTVLLVLGGRRRRFHRASDQYSTSWKVCGVAVLWIISISAADAI